LRRFVFPRQRSTGPADARGPLRRPRVAQVALLLGWTAFWINAALFPCCVALATVHDEQSGARSESALATQPARNTDMAVGETTHHDLLSLCDYALESGVQTSGAYPAPATNPVQSDWLATGPSIVAGLTAANHSSTFAPRKYQIPPPLRLYLHTQRLLI